MSAEQTVTVEVPPGNQTGLYYITICNLPFGVNWQHVKDWVRTVCDVDRAEVFPSSTSGWVRVRGKANFEKAFALLNGGVLSGRSIIADGKNRNKAVTIKQLVQPSPEQQQTPPPPQVVSSQMAGYNKPAGQATARQYSSTTGQYYGAGYGQAGQAGGLSYSGQSMPTQGYARQPSAPAAAAMSATYAPTGPRDYYNYSGANVNAGPPTGASSGVGYSPNYQYDAAQFSLPYRGQAQQEASVPTTAYYAGGGIPGLEMETATDQTTYVATEARKLHVSHFPQQEKRHEVEAWIRHKIHLKQTIESIHIPMNQSSKYLRGHAFVVFDSAASATAAMEQLNKARFQGRRVIARPTVEGVAVGEPAVLPLPVPEASRASEAHLGQARPIPTGPRDDRQRGDKSHRSRHSKGADADRKRSSDKKSSSSTKKSSKTSSKKSSSDKKESSSTKNAGSVVVVDGTSRK